MAKALWQIVIALILGVLATPMVKSFYFSEGHRWQYIFLFSFLAAYFVTPFCRILALRLNIMDRPDWRKIHDRPTPLFGGIAIFLSFAVSLLLNGVFLSGMKVLLVGSALVFFMGIIDDVRPLPALLKLCMQVLISLLVILWGDIQLTFFYHASWAALLNVPLTVLWLVGLTNAFNFLDGVDGLAVSLSIITAFFLGIIAFNTHQPALGWFAVALIGACTGFMPYNFRFRESALLFLGDAGSTFLGFTLAGLAVLGEWSTTSHFVSLSSPMLVFGVFIFDMVYVTLSRIKNRRSNNVLEILLSPNQDHFHHRLIFMGFPRKEVVLIISTLCVCMGVSALIIMNQRFIDAVLGLFQAVLILALIVTLMLRGRECADLLNHGAPPAPLRKEEVPSGESGEQR
jgi:UDP-GlcNAc:undecaprenyl-phosphate/decaprenyl-phosphate GlcNAc-1-phosphate transferase